MELKVSLTEWSPAGNVNRFNKALSNQLCCSLILFSLPPPSPSLFLLRPPAAGAPPSSSACLGASVVAEWRASGKGYCHKNNLHAALILRAFRRLRVCLFSVVSRRCSPPPPPPSERVLLRSPPSAKIHRSLCGSVCVRACVLVRAPKGRIAAED